MRELVTCPTCGGSGRVAAAEAARDEQTLSDRDQTTSDQDQTWSDQDQTASDSDSDSSEADQRASDRDLAAGGDPAVHEQTRSARAHEATTRDDVSLLRDETAENRLGTAEERDAAAAERDRQAEGRDDLLAAQHGESSDPAVAQIREQAAQQRATAAADRARAAADRAAASRDREEARRARSQAEHELKVAATDGLTGAWTRRAGLAQITNEIERARRTGATLTVAFVDVDQLKEVNDTHGHEAGDQLLSLVVKTMRDHLRPYDIIVRYGGDEFLCALPYVSSDTATERLSAIAATLSTHETGHAISFGVAEHHPDEGLRELIARADATMMEVRRSRRAAD